MCAVSSTSARARRRLELPPELLGRPSFADQFDDALPELRWVWPTALRHRGCSFPPQPWGVHETGSTPRRAAATARATLDGGLVGVTVPSGAVFVGQVEANAPLVSGRR